MFKHVYNIFNKTMKLKCYLEIKRYFLCRCLQEAEKRIQGLVSELETERLNSGSQRKLLLGSKGETAASSREKQELTTQVRIRIHIFRKCWFSLVILN